MLRRQLGALVVFLVLATPAVAIDSAVLVYGLDRLSDEHFDRILTAPEITHVCFQVIMPPGPLPALTRERCAPPAA